MDSKYEGTSPLSRMASVAASSSAEIGLINCRNLSSVVITGRVTYHASATGAVTINFYYSPDGKNFDTVALDSKALTISAGATVQASKIVTLPDSGWLKITAANADATYAASSLVVWATVITQFIEDRQTLPST